MARVVVCCKWVLAENEILVDSRTRALDLSRAHRKLSDYDRNTIEAARITAAALQADLVAVSYGGEDVRGCAKDALGRGPDEALLITAGAGDAADGHVTAHALAAAIRELGDVRVVFCSEGASDTYAHQIGPRVAELLGWPVVTNAGAVTVDGDRLTATRELESERQTVEVSLPVVVTAVPGIATAPIPGLRAVLGAARKPVTVRTPQELGLPADATTPRTRVSDVLGQVTERRRKVIEAGDPREQVQTLIAELTRTGVL